jgi:TIR domain-containing protein
LCGRRLDGARALDTFISYSSKDKTAADAACAVLERAGIRCWIAPRDIRPGQEYGQSIIEAIDRCRVMVLIFSANANDSRQTHREIERAVSKGIPIIPLRIEEVVPTKSMEYFLGAIHWLDALTPPLEKTSPAARRSCKSIVAGRSRRSCGATS